MSEPFIPESLIPPSINDERSRAIVSVLSQSLEEFDLRDLLIVDAMTVDSKLLPAMAVERAMTDFILPEMREIHVRRLLDDYREIHAQSGYISGTRRALRAIGIEVQWVQWWQKEPMGAAGTHTVSALAEDTIFENDDNLLGDRTLDVIRRFIHLTQRWSQDIEFEIILGVKTPVYLGAYTSFRTELNILPFVFDVDTSPAQQHLGAATSFHSLLTVNPR